MNFEFHITAVQQGEVALSADSTVTFGALLGSCISVCMYDPFLRIGGMNHFLIPRGIYEYESHGSKSALLYGEKSMQYLIKSLLDMGGDRSRLLCKAFGGAALHANMTDIGQQNVRFLIKYLQYEKIKCVSYSLGGHRARRIRFWPTTGKVMQSLVSSQQLEMGIENGNF